MMDAGGAIDGTLSFGSDYRSDAMAGQRALDTTDRDTGCRFMHPDDSTDSDDTDDSDDSADATSGQRFDSPFKDADTDKALNKVYAQHWYWPCLAGESKAPKPELTINPHVTIGGSVTIQYASQNTLPTFNGKETK